jgi:hypothetical protein
MTRLPFCISDERWLRVKIAGHQLRCEPSEVVARALDEFWLRLPSKDAVRAARAEYRRWVKGGRK